MDSRNSHRSRTLQAGCSRPASCVRQTMLESERACSRGKSERVGDGLPLLKATSDELGPLVLVPAVQCLQIREVGAQVDAGCSGVHAGVAIRACDPVPGRPVGRLQPDLPGTLQLRCVRMARPLASPEVEDTRRVAAFLRGLTSVAG